LLTTGAEFANTIAGKTAKIIVIKRIVSVLFIGLTPKKGVFE
jgi:hypothetical protein